MEEAEKRRERLRAMRMEAHSSSSSSTCNQIPVNQQQQQTLIINPNDNSNDSNTPALLNPLLLLQQQGAPPQRPRFDYYTDPLAAFSSHKPPSSSSSSSASAAGSRNSEMSHSGFQQFHNSLNIHRDGVPYNSPSPCTSPAGPSYSPRPINAPLVPRSPFPVHQGRPTFGSGPYRGPQFHNSPNSGFGGGGSPYLGHQGSPNVVPRAQGMSPSPNHCPSPSYGRGRGRWDSGRMSSDSRYSGGRGGRGHSFDSHGRSYYDRSMVEDPWSSLTPVVWQVDDDFNSWGSVKITSRPKTNRGSVRVNSSSKKPRVSKTLDNEPSLAEFLAATADQVDGDDAANMSTVERKLS